MDDTRDRGPGATLLEPEDVPGAANAAAPRNRPGGERMRSTPRLAVAAEPCPGVDGSAPDADHPQPHSPSDRTRERSNRAAVRVIQTTVTTIRALLRRSWAAVRRASAGLAPTARALPAVTRRTAIGAWGWAVARATPGRLIGLLACGLSIGFYAWYAGRGLTLAYNDGITHMLIARRVLMSRTPGLAQLGTVWPPLTHILMLPFVWNETLFRSGLAGALPSMAAYVVAAVAMYRLGDLAFSSRTAGVVAALTLMLNPDALYMQTTPMTEMGLMCALILAVYYALRWVREQRPLDLVFCAVVVAAGTLIRYDAWAIALGMLALVGYVAWQRRGRTYAEASVLVFAMLGFAGCAAWFLYNQVIFGDALAFLRGPYSSAVQQQIVAAGNGLPTRGNVWRSLLTYSVASLDSVGWVIAGMALASALIWCYRARARLNALPLYLVWVPFAFNWFSLYNGTSTLDTVELPVAGMRTYFNERYGMMMIPAAALFIGYLAGVLRQLHDSREVARMSQWLSARARHIPMRPYTIPANRAASAVWHRSHVALALLPLAIVAVVSLGITFGGTPYALEDPLRGISAGGRVQIIAETAWLQAHAHASGTILAGYSSYGSVIFLTGFPDHTFVTDSDGALFQSALAHPERTVTWILMDANADPRDPVWQALHSRQDWRQFYILRAVIGSTQIYERISTDGMT